MQPPLEKRSARASTLTILQLIVSGMGMAGALTGAGLLLLVGLANFLKAPGEAASTAAFSSTAWVCVLMAALTVPSIYFSIQRLRGVPSTPNRANTFRAATILTLAWPALLVFGNWASSQNTLSWILLPPLQILAVGLPVWWIFEFTRLGLSAGSPQREWGIVNFSLFVTTPLVIVTELFVFLFAAAAWIVWLVNQPALVQEIEALAQKLLFSQPDPESILPVLMPYLQKPGVIPGLLAGLSILIPLIEEALKPTALWLLAGRRVTPGEGFVAGALCGGVFAFIESLLSLSNQTGQAWGLMVVGRAGTGILHVTTTALVGWAITSAWQKRSYLQLALVYFVSAGLHGLWNALSVFWGMGSLAKGTVEMPQILVAVSQVAPAGLLLLAIFLFALLWIVRRRLRQASAPPAPMVYNSP